ncbi:MAG: hypothetical protein LBR44_09325 [Clostridiales Family XIII bacterium]|jgi:hypothetical protein|nr:hypothetical protein [Clostridiales Family XIII bacterium]
MMVMVIIVMIVSSVAMTSYHRTQVSQVKTQAYYTAQSVCDRFANWLDGTTTASSTDLGMMDRQKLLRDLGKSGEFPPQEYGEADLGSGLGEAKVTVKAVRTGEIVYEGKRIPYPLEISIEVEATYAGTTEKVTTTLALAKQTSFTEQSADLLDAVPDTGLVTAALAMIEKPAQGGGGGSDAVMEPGLWQTAAKPAWQLGHPKGWAYFNPVLGPGKLEGPGKIAEPGKLAVLEKDEVKTGWTWTDGEGIPQTEKAVPVDPADEGSYEAAQIVVLNPYYYSRASEGEQGLATSDYTKDYYAHFIDKYTVDTAGGASDNLVVRLAFDYRPTVSADDHSIDKGAHPDQRGYDWYQEVAGAYPGRATKGILLLPTVANVDKDSTDAKYQHAGVYYYTAAQSDANPGAMDVTLGPWRETDPGNQDYTKAKASSYGKLGLYFTDADKTNADKDGKRLTVQGGLAIEDFQLYTVRGTTLGEAAKGFPDGIQKIQTELAIGGAIDPAQTEAKAQLVFADPGVGQTVRQSVIGPTGGAPATKINNAAIVVENRHVLTLGPAAKITGPAGAAQTILVNPGGELILDGATVTGNIVVRAGASLTVKGGTVTGDIFILGGKDAKGEGKDGLVLTGGTLNLNFDANNLSTDPEDHDSLDKHGIFLYNHPTLGVATMRVQGNPLITGNVTGADGMGGIHAFSSQPQVTGTLADRLFCDDRDHGNNVCSHFDTDNFIWQKRMSGNA